MIKFHDAAFTVPTEVETPSRRPQRSTSPPDVVIVAATSLHLSERRLALIGANGSGKSTLARMINGLTLPSSGTVTVGGLDTRTNGAEVRKRVGFVFSDADAQLVMPTPIEDVALSLRRSKLSRSERDARAHSVLAQLGLSRVASVPVQALSGGQKQLLALAGVLVTEPEVLVCDEPTTRLDLRWRRHIDELLASLTQQVLIVTHDLDVASTADRCLVMDAGHIVHDSAGVEAVQAYRDLCAQQPLPGSGPGLMSSAQSGYR